MGRVKKEVKEGNNKSNASRISHNFRAYLPFTAGIIGLCNPITPSMEKKANNKPVWTSHSIGNMCFNV